MNNGNFEYDRDARAAEDISRVVENISKPKTRAYSVLSLVLALLALLIDAFGGWFGLGLALLALAFSVVSRRHLGYFDRLSLAGLVLGLCAAVFAVAAIAFVYLLESGALDAYLAPFFEGFGGGEMPPPTGSF